jgi:hypothetical protein
LPPTDGHATLSAIEETVTRLMGHDICVPSSAIIILMGGEYNLNPNTSQEKNKKKEGIKYLLSIIIWLILIIYIRNICSDLYQGFKEAIPDEALASDEAMAGQTRLPSETITEKPPGCSKIRFAEALGPDDVDDLINEARSFSDVSETQARFDCQDVTGITFKWIRNNEDHCTYVNNTSQCDQSWKTTWNGLPDKYLITLFITL